MYGFTRNEDHEMVEANDSRTVIREQVLGYINSKWMVNDIMVSYKSSFASKLSEIQSLDALQDMTVSPEGKPNINGKN